MLHLLSYRTGSWRGAPLGSYMTRFLCSIKTALLNASSATFRKIVFVLNLMLRCDLLTCHFVTVFWQMTKPQSFSVLLQLPFRQLESVFEVSTKCDLSGNIFHKVFRFLRWVHANYIMNWSSPIGAFLVNI